MSLYDVASRTELHFSTIGKYERGERRPSLETLRELAGVYEVDLSTLLQDPVDPRPDLAHLLASRPDVEGLARMAARMAPEQVLLLTELLRTLIAKPDA